MVVAVSNVLAGVVTLALPLVMSTVAVAVLVVVAFIVVGAMTSVAEARIGVGQR